MWITCIRPVSPASNELIQALLDDPSRRKLRNLVVLGTTLEELYGQQPARAADKRGPAPKFQKQLERITQLPRAQQRVVMQMLDGVLAQASR